MADAYFVARHHVDQKDADRHFFQRSTSRSVTVVWPIRRTLAGPNGEADHHLSASTRFRRRSINVKNIESQTVGRRSVDSHFLPTKCAHRFGNRPVTAVSQTILRRMPPGAQPPFHHPLQRLERSYFATRSRSQDTD